MNTRRKFLLQGSMATTALIAANPFKSIANTLSPLTGFSVNDNKVIFLHTGDHEHNRQVTISQVSHLKKNTGNLLMIHTGNITDSLASKLKYDVKMSDELSEVISNNGYRIIYKGNIKTGIISVAEGEKEAVKRINTLSTWLKKEKGCHLVVCLSQLGYKNKTAIDDRRLAEESTHLDIIISGHHSNISKRPYITRNTKKEEVVINSAAGNIFDFGNIEIVFDENRKKKSIAINNLRKQFNVEGQG